jgi:hypothetical protein
LWHVWETGQLYAGFWCGDLKERDQEEDNIKMDQDGGIDWIDMAQGRDRRRSLVNAVMNLLVPSNVGIFLTS